MRISRGILLISLAVLLLLGVLAAVVFVPRLSKSKTDREVAALLETVTDENSGRWFSLYRLEKYLPGEIRSCINLRFPLIFAGVPVVLKEDVAEKIHVNYGDSAVPALLDVLKTNRRAKVREAAAYALWFNFSKSLNPEVAAALWDAMKSDKHPQVRAQAARCLRYLNSEENIDNLLAAFKSDLDEVVCSAAASSLGYVQTVRAVPEFISFLGTIKEAEKKLFGAGTAAAPRYLAGRLMVYEYVARALMFIRDPRAVPALVNASNAVLDQSFRLKAIEALGSFDDNGAFLFLAGTVRNGNDPDLKIAAARSLENYEDFGAVEALSSALQSEADSYVKMAIAESLERLSSDAAVPFLFKDLMDGEGGRRERTIMLLGRLAVAEAEPELVSILREGTGPNSTIFDRENAVKALGNIRRESSIPALMSVFDNDPDPSLRVKALEALGNFNDSKVHYKIVKALNGQGTEMAKAAVSALGKMGKPCDASILVSILERTEDRYNLRAPMEALGEIGEAETAAALLPFLYKIGSDMYDSYCWALGHIGDPRAVDTLGRLLSENNGSVSSAASFALAEIGDPRAVPLLEEARKKDNSDHVKFALECSLAFLKQPQVARDLERRLRMPGIRGWMRFYAICALLRLGTDEAKSILEENSGGRFPEEREFYRRILSGEGVNALKCTLQSKKIMHRLNSAKVLMFFDDVPPEIISIIDDIGMRDRDEETRRAARMAARHIRHREELKKAGRLPSASIKGD